jgi:hypothetical protein
MLCTLPAPLRSWVALVRKARLDRFAESEGAELLQARCRLNSLHQDSMFISHIYQLTLRSTLAQGLPELAIISRLPVLQQSPDHLRVLHDVAGVVAVRRNPDHRLGAWSDPRAEFPDYAHGLPPGHPLHSVASNHPALSARPSVVKHSPRLQELLELLPTEYRLHSQPAGPLHQFALFRIEQREEELDERATQRRRAQWIHELFSGAAVQDAFEVAE